MNITFKNNKLSDTLNSQKEIFKLFGKKNGKKIMSRMMFLKAAPTLSDVPHRPPERRHELKGARKGEFAVDLEHPFRLVFKPNHNPLPLKDDGSINLESVTDIKILGVEDYH